MFTKRLQYINFLMNLYRDMIGKNEEVERKWILAKESWDKMSEKEKKIYYWYFHYYHNDIQPYSDTMLHSIITIINKLNNNEI